MGHGDHAAGSLAIDKHYDEFQSTIMTREPCHSLRAGASLGGRAQQLEKIGTILESWVVRSHKTIDLPESTIPNPLAPLAGHARVV